MKLRYAESSLIPVLLLAGSAAGQAVPSRDHSAHDDPAVRRGDLRVDRRGGGLDLGSGGGVGRGRQWRVRQPDVAAGRGEAIGSTW